MGNKDKCHKAKRQRRQQKKAERSAPTAESVEPGLVKKDKTEASPTHKPRDKDTPFAQAKRMKSKGSLRRAQSRRDYSITVLGPWQHELEDSPADVKKASLCLIGNVSITKPSRCTTERSLIVPQPRSTRSGQIPLSVLSRSFSSMR